MAQQFEDSDKNAEVLIVRKGAAAVEVFVDKDSLEVTVYKRDADDPAFKETEAEDGNKKEEEAAAKKTAAKSSRSKKA